MKLYKELLDGNKVFVKEALEKDPDYFKKLSKGQAPKYLWIGCSDSRVPANQITNTQPGDVFVHRNISNLVINTDMNLLSVLEYAIKFIKVKHIIVCGHYGCGGVLAAMSNKQHGLIDNWLSNIKDIYRENEEELLAIEDEKKRGERLVELNVTRQVQNLCKISIIQDAWKEGQFPTVNGWVYGLEDGIIKDLKVSVGGTDEISSIYHFLT